MPETTVPPALIDSLKSLLGPRGWIEDDGGKAAYVNDIRGLYHGSTPLVVRPCDTGEVAGVIRLCSEAGIPVVPQGGNTGYVGGGVPDASGGTIVLSLARMNRVRDIDPLNNTITVEAGCVLADVQAAARRAERLFPLSLAAEGSCTLGGNLSTNAGGVAVLRYGNTRDLVLGLEVVMADGRVWDGLRRLRKDNTGYDLKQLFIGAEGTLGVITAAVLKLFPLPRDSCTVWIAVPDPAAAIRLLSRFRSDTGDAVVSFEYIDRGSLDLVLEHKTDARDPLADRHEHIVLAELVSPRFSNGLRESVEAVLGDALDSGDALDATLAVSEAQAQALWALREFIPEAQKLAGGCIKHDVSVPVSAVAAFIAEATAVAHRRLPGVRVVAFGHLGDGNIHFNLTQPRAADAATFVAQTGAVSPLIHDVAMGMGGSFSAEHGIGVLKRDELRQRRSPLELDLMERLKRTFDPQGTLNPGKLI